MGKQFEINRKDLRQTRWIETSTKMLQDGEIELAIEKFGFTANNITYANLGDSFKYWNFFPAEEGSGNIWGIIPSWGFGKVVESKNSSIQKGDRFYGYYPTASSLVVRPGKVRATGFSDTSDHRAKLPTAYNFYYNIAQDDFYELDSENFQLIFRPLFTTSFLLDDYLNENNLFSGKVILITSASSKTAIALAFLLQERRKKENLSFKIQALTSMSNSNWVKSLGYYDSVFSYEQVSSLSTEDTCVVDFSGNQKIQNKIKDFLGNKFKHLCLVGIVHWEEQALDSTLSGGVLFFAPTQIKKRSKEWGLDQFQVKLVSAFRAFYLDSTSWIQLKEYQLEKSFEEIYISTLEGKFPVDTAPILTLR